MKRRLYIVISWKRGAGGTERRTTIHVPGVLERSNIAKVGGVR